MYMDNQQTNVKLLLVENSSEKIIGHAYFDTDSAGITINNLTLKHENFIPSGN